jgi:hypothetical protein
MTGNEVLSRSLWFVRCQALLAFAQDNFTDSQKLWYSIRQTTDKSGDENARYHWWEARYFGLRCLLNQNKQKKVVHVIEVLKISESDPHPDWMKQIHKLYLSAQNQIETLNLQENKPYNEFKGKKDSIAALSILHDAITESGLLFGF